MAKGLREQLIGAWKLSYEERPIDGSPSFYPMTEEPMGIIMYTPDGYMSAQLSKPNRKPFASGDWFKGSAEEYEQEATSYIAYTGEFHVNEEAKTLKHSMFVSLFPNWIGQTQRRVVQIDGNDLYLSTASPIQSGGKEVNSHLRWKRAKANQACHGSVGCSEARGGRPTPRCGATLQGSQLIKCAGRPNSDY